MFDKETAARLGRQKEVSRGVCLIHFVPWRAQHCAQAEQGPQGAVAAGGGGLPRHCRLADLQPLQLLPQLANHHCRGGTVHGKSQIPRRDLLQLEQVQIMFVVCS